MKPLQNDVVLRLLRLMATAVALVLATPTSAADATKPVKVFLFAGQSNMEGGDAHPERIDDYSMFKGAGMPQPDVLYTYLAEPGQPTFRGWGPLQPLRVFGPELTFARRLKGHDNSTVAIIKSAIGGTTVAFDWNPEAPDKGQKLYPRTLRLIQESLQDLTKRGLRYQLEGVMWHQGENDMLNRSLGTNYAAGLQRLIAQLRTDLHAPELKWFIAEVSEKGIWGMDNRQNLAVLRRQQDQVLKADPLLHWVPTSHLAFDVMNSGQPHYHFGTQGQLQMGEAFAGAYLEAIGSKPADQKREFKESSPLARGSRVHVFVLAGQRNMEGEDSFVSEIDPGLAFAPLVQNQENVAFRYSLGGGVKVSAEWEPLGPVEYLGNFGPELSFGLQLRKAIDAKEGVAIVKFTHSGAQGPDWFPRGSPEAHRNLYPKFIAFLRAALQDLARQGCESQLEGVFWSTGENDTYFGPYRQKYAVWMKDLIARVRLDLQRPTLPWFITEQHPKAIWRNMDAINASLKTMAQAEQQVFVIPTANLPHARAHFGTQGTLQLGDEMAKAWRVTSR